MIGDYSRSVLLDYLGWPDGIAQDHQLDALLGAKKAGENGQLLGEALQAGLTAKEDLDVDLSPKAPRCASDVHRQLAEVEEGWITQSARDERPMLTLARWPGDAPFALFLSHDIDQIYDRELFRILADINHVRRTLTQGERGHVGQACRRIARACFRPKDTLLDFRTILEIEQRFGFQSTFFALHDRYWARQGARFSFDDPEFQEIGRMALAAGCELGVHGGYYRFNAPTLYSESRDRLLEVFGVEAVGIRNHLLRYSYPETWLAQAEAGFEYDSTFGFRSVPGPRPRLAMPFFAYDESRRRALDLLELPLILMDATLFRYLGLGGEAAVEFAWKLVERIASFGGLVTLLWHNNFFNEPEYWDWQMVYEKLLERLAALKPWCATGAQINQWWRRRSKVAFQYEAQKEFDVWRLRVPDPIEGLTLRLRSRRQVRNVRVVGALGRVEEMADGFRVVLPRLPQSSECELWAEPSNSRG